MEQNSCRNSLTKAQYLQTDSSQLGALTYNNSFPGSHVSITEQEILTHPIILEIYQQSRNNTVLHNVNIIPISTKLYVEKGSKYGMVQQAQENDDYVCTTSLRIRDIKRRLSTGKKLSDRLKQITNKSQDEKSKAKKRTYSEDNINKRVSVSGLVTYNFSSVNARKSLGYIPDQPKQERIKSQMTKSKAKTSQSFDRKCHILSRKPNPLSVHRLEISKAAVCDFHSGTDKFLKLIHSQSKKDQNIYGQKMERLNCIKQFMWKEKSNYEDSKYIMEKVVSSKDEQVRASRTHKKIVQSDEDKELMKRKKVQNNKKIMVKHLSFIET